MSEICKYAEVCPVCCGQQEVDTVGCEYFKLRDTIADLLNDKDELLGKINSLLTENEELKKKSEDTHVKLNLYYMYILRSSLLLESITGIKWDNTNPEVILQQVNSIVAREEEKENEKSKEEQLKNEVMTLYARIRNLKEKLNRASKAINCFMEEE